MESFRIAIASVLVMLFYMVPGYIIRKMGRARPEHLPTISAILVYIGTPFLLISAFMSLEFSWELVTEMAWFFAVTFVLQVAFLLILFCIFKKLKRIEDAKYRVMSIGSIVGNVGFFGMPVLRSLFPDSPEVACYSAMFMLSMNVIVFTVGVFCLTKEKKYISLRAAFINPTMLGFAIALPIYFLGLARYFPEALTNAIGAMGSLTAPLCMFILGIRLASAPVKRIFCDFRVYVTAFLKLLVFPLFCYACVYFLPFSEAFRGSVLILSGMPCAAVLLSLAEMHKKETEMSANCIFVSTMACFLTVPLLALLL